MDVISRFLSRIRTLRNQSRVPRFTIEEILKPEISKLRETDAGTARQWHSLQLAVEKRRAEESRQESRKLRFARPAVAFAVTAALVTVAVLIWVRQSVDLRYQTGRGQQTSITLSDSSQVTLNHTSLLLVDRKPVDGARHVRLIGEAFFRIRHTGTPFVVSTDIASVRVLGTDFNIRVRDNQLSVAVLNGSVEVIAQRDGRDSSVVLAAHQIVTCGIKDFPGTPTQLPFPDYPGWTNGKLLFYRTSLLAACDELQSQFDVVIRIDTPAVGNETITGAVEARNVEAALSTLCRLTGNAYRHENNGYILY